ncbi:glutathione transferase [Aureococcus anophagefferens]|nr:glutathione transferase [Aureococcus anophagefferens]
MEEMMKTMLCGETGGAPLSEASYKLYYFDIAGKGEGIRLAFTYCGVPFEDYRFADREEFNEMKASGRLMFGQVPALEVSPLGKEVTLLNQSAAVLRFIGKLKPEYKDRFGFGFLGDEANAAQLAAAVEANNGEVIPRHLATLAKHVEAGGTGWLAGTAGPTIADFAWVPVLAAIADGWTGDAAALDATPALVALKDKFYALPEIKAYYDAKAAAQVGETKAV